MQFRFPDQTIRVNVRSIGALLDEVRARFRAGRGFALATINLDHLVKLRASVEYRQAYADQDLVVADGNPIVWLSQINGDPVELVPGSDIVQPILEVAAQERMPVAFFGSTESVLHTAAERLMRDIPGLSVVWCGSPAMGFDPKGAEAEKAVGAMRQAGARLCIISLSAPRQETFAAFGRDLAPEIGFCGFGAGLDFVAGRQMRAPRWVRVLALEWLWRALSAPTRLIPRYIACAAILPSLTVEAIRQRGK